MWRSTIIAWMAALALLTTGCWQGAGNSHSGSTKPTSPPGRPEGRATTPEQTVSADTLECRSDMAVSGVVDYAPGARGKKATPVELARRGFSKNIEESDDVVAARGQKAGSVLVIRNGRVVAIIEYRRAGGGWLYDHYDACSDF